MDRLLTQCPQCATLFKVSANQLQLGEGQVRCGACMHVFNGADAIIQSNTEGQSDHTTQDEMSDTDESNDLNHMLSTQTPSSSSQKTGNNKNNELEALDKELDAIFDDSYLNEFGLDDTELESDELLESQLSEAEAQLLNTPLDQLNDIAAEASEILDFDDFDFEDELDDFDLDASLDFDNLLAEESLSAEPAELSQQNNENEDIELDNNIKQSVDNQQSLEKQQPSVEKTDDAGALDNVLNFDALKQKRIAEKEQYASKSSETTAAPAQKPTMVSDTQTEFNIDQFRTPNVPNDTAKSPANELDDLDIALEPAIDQPALEEPALEEPAIEEPAIEERTIEEASNQNIDSESDFLERTELEEPDIEATDLEGTDIESTDIESTDLDTLNVLDQDFEETLIDDELVGDETVDLDAESLDSLEDLELETALNELIEADDIEQTSHIHAEIVDSEVEAQPNETNDDFDTDLIDLDTDIDLDAELALENESYLNDVEAFSEDASDIETAEPADIEPSVIKDRNNEVQDSVAQLSDNAPELSVKEQDDREVLDQEAEIIADFIAAQSELDLEQNVVDALDVTDDIDEFTEPDIVDDLLENDLVVDDSEVETQTLFDQYNDELESISITSEQRILADLNPQQEVESTNEMTLDNINELSDVEEGRLPWQQQKKQSDANLEEVLKKSDLSYDALAIADIQVNQDQPESDEVDSDILIDQDETRLDSSFDITEQLIEVEDYSNLKRLLWFMGSIILAFTLILQYVWFYRAELQYDPFWQPLVEEVCQSLPCQLAPKRDVSKINISHRLVKPISSSKNQMSVDLMLVNNATFEQPYPTIIIDFSDHNGTILSKEKILPAQYLSAKRQMSLMPKAVDIHVHFEMNKPANQVTGYTFKFE
jgi:predicted Zn finger-like uncharacterized protein